MADVFVSYTRSDLAHVEPLIRALENAGYSVWWDRDLAGGSIYSKEIEAEIARAKIVLVVWTQHSIASQWVSDEAELGRRHNKLIPLTIGGVEPPIGFRQIQTLDGTDLDRGPDSAALPALLKSCQRLAPPVTDTPGSEPAPSPASIAVLPFVNMSSDPEQEFFSDGISEELLNLLAKIKQMRVTARTSSFSFKGTDRRIEEIGTLLNVAHVLEGSVRKAGNRVRITAQLIEVSSGFHMWSETYDRTLDDIFAVQDEISAAIVEALKAHILVEVKAPQTDRITSVEAYEFCLLGQQFFNRRTRADLEKSRTYFEQALKLDPDYARALLGLAEAHLLLSDTMGCYGTTPLHLALETAWQFITRALAIVPETEEMYCTLSLYHQLEDDLDKSISFARAAISLNQNLGLAYHVLINTLVRVADPDVPTIPYKRRMLEIDPMSMVDLVNLFYELAWYGNFEEAGQILTRMEAIDNKSHFYLLSQSVIPMYRGNYKDCLALLFGPHAALMEGRTVFTTQLVATTIGMGTAFEKCSPVFALRLFAERNMMKDAQRLAENLREHEGGVNDYDRGLAFALLHIREGRHEAALALLNPWDAAEPGRWGRHFDLDYVFCGARLSWYARTQVGERAEADRILSKLRRLHRILLESPDKDFLATHFLGAYIALADGDKDKSLDELEHQVSQTMYCADVFLMDPALESLHSEPAWQALCAKVEDHFDKEREAAVTAGLLPVPEHILALIPGA